jgi:hypothetical protein
LAKRANLTWLLTTTIILCNNRGNNQQGLIGNASTSVYCLLLLLPCIVSVLVLPVMVGAAVQAKTAPPVHALLALQLADTMPVMSVVQIQFEPVRSRLQFLRGLQLLRVVASE